MKRIVFFLICCGLMTMACKGTTGKAIREAEAHRKLGEAYLLENNYVAAFRELTAAQKMDPDNPIVYNDMGLVYMNRDKLSEALTNFRKALSLKPDYSDAVLNMAVTYLKLEQWDAAIEQLKTLESDMLYAAPQKVYLNLGYAYFMKGGYTEASGHYHQAIRHYEDGFNKDVTYIMAVLGQMRVALKTGHADTALKLADKGLRDAPQVPELHFYRGAALELLGKPADARNAYLRAIELAPEGEISKQAVSALRGMAN